MSKSHNLSQIRSCIEKPVPHEQQKFAELRKKANSDQHYKHLQAAFWKKKIWDKNVNITIKFLPIKDNHPKWTNFNEVKAKNPGVKIPLDPLEYKIRDLSPQDAVKKVVTERIMPIVGLNIRFVNPDQPATVKVSFVFGEGACSLVGTDHLSSATNESTLNLGWLDVGTIVHEFCHMLGMIHEHQNPKGNQIQWNEDAVYEWAKNTQGWDKTTTYENIIKRYKTSQLNETNYDPNSIMLYFFPPELTTNGKGSHQNFVLSPEDVEFISTIYPGGRMTPEEFYQHAYQKDIGVVRKQGWDTSRSLSSNIKKNKLLFVGIVAAVILLIGLVVWWVSRKSKPSHSSSHLSQQGTFFFGKKMPSRPSEPHVFV